MSALQQLDQVEEVFASEAPEQIDPVVDTQQKLAECMAAIVDGDYMVSVEGSDTLSHSINELVTNLRERGSTGLQRVVTLSVEANETAILAADLFSNLRSVDTDAQSVASAAEQMSGSAKEIDVYGKNISEQAQNAQSLTEQGIQASEQAAAVMGEIVTSVEESVESVSKLKSFSEQISAISDDIKKIADNTNLLAINAAIEAARAGEAGKGFAVVADEVRRLSGHTKNATTQVTELTTNLAIEAENVLDAMTRSRTSVEAGDTAIGDVSKIVSEVNENIIQVTKSASQISDALLEQQKAAEDVSEGITRIAGNASESVVRIEQIMEAMDHVQRVVTEQMGTYGSIKVPNKTIMLAQSDHVIWKKRLANMMAGRTGLHADELADHHSCRLGKWYDLVDDPKITSHPSFKALIGPHELVHSHGIQAVKYYNAGQHDAALAEIEEVAKASEVVLSLLRSLAG